MMVRGVLLDVDGTLLDSNDAHATAWKRALHDEGVTVAHDRVRRLIGMGADEFLPQVGLSEDDPRAKRAVAKKNVIFREELVANLRPTRGARDFVAKLREAGIARIVASSSNGRDLHTLLRAAGVTDLIEAQATSSDADRSKPNPDIVDAAVARSGLTKDALVMLGDTPYDVIAAKRAGVAIVCVRCGGWDDGSLHGASAIYDDPQAIFDGFASSLFARKAAS
jgi:HAD superfamily hydrolase (TIGR01509 family)